MAQLPEPDEIDRRTKEEGERRLSPNLVGGALVIVLATTVGVLPDGAGDAATAPATTHDENSVLAVFCSAVATVGNTIGGILSVTDTRFGQPKGSSSRRTAEQS